MDESLTILRRLMTGEVMDFDGEFYTLDQASIAPAPEVSIPILVGGRSDAAIRRAGTFGDGWLGIWISPRRYAEVVDTMSTVARESGRGEVEWRNGLNLWCGVGETKEAARRPVADMMQNFYQMPYERFEKWSPHGTVDDLAEFVAPFVEAGCHEFNLLVCGEDLDTELDAVARIKKMVAELEVAVPGQPGSGAAEGDVGDDEGGDAGAAGQPLEVGADGSDVEQQALQRRRDRRPRGPARRNCAVADHQALGADARSRR